MTPGTTGNRASNVNRILSANQLIFLFYHRYTLQIPRAMIASSLQVTSSLIHKPKKRESFSSSQFCFEKSQGRADQPFLVCVPGVRGQLHCLRIVGSIRRREGRVADETNPVTVTISILSEPSSHFYESLKWQNLGQHEGAVLPSLLGITFYSFPKKNTKLNFIDKNNNPLVFQLFIS